MSAKMMRRLRRLAYGSGHHPGPVIKYHHPKIRGVVIADEPRRRYQNLKQAYKRRLFTL